MTKKKKDKTAALKKEFDNLLADFDSLLQESADLTGEEFAEARAKLHEKVDEAKESVFDFRDDMSRRAHKTASRANSEVHEDPWKAIGAGVVAGLFLGILFARR